MTKSVRSFNPEVAKQVLAFLRDGSPPFLRVAARRARYPETVVDWWWRAGRAEHADPSDPQTRFALEVEGIRADYVATWSQWLQSVDKHDAEAARQVSWILTRLDRDMFDTSRPPKEAKAGESNKPAHTQKTPADVAAVLEDLDS